MTDLALDAALARCAALEAERDRLVADLEVSEARREQLAVRLRLHAERSGALAAFYGERARLAPPAERLVLEMAADDFAGLAKGLSRTVETDGGTAAKGAS